MFAFLSTMVAHAQETLSIVFLTDKDRVEQQQDANGFKQGHNSHILKLERDRSLLVRGIFEGGNEMLIMNTASIQQAREWMTGDPSLKNHFKMEILPWAPRIGTTCPAQENVKNEPLTFIQYNIYITKFNVREAPVLFQDHDEHLSKLVKTGNVVYEGLFGNNDGGILIMKGEVDPAVIMTDPAVINGIVEPVIKTLWITHGSFCKLG